MENSAFMRGVPITSESLRPQPPPVCAPCHVRTNNLDGPEVLSKLQGSYLECFTSWTKWNGRELCACFLFSVVRAKRAPLCHPLLFSLMSEILKR